MGTFGDGSRVLIRMRRAPSSSGPWSSWQRFDFAARVAGLSARRLLRWTLEPAAFPEPRRVAPDRYGFEIARATIPRRASSFGARLEAGRWRNLSLASAALDGLALSPARPFSFWRTVGRLEASRGFVEGAHFEGGCIVPAIGGGICALSDALFDVALRSDCTIVERHAHTLAVDRGDDKPLRRRVDATVKWPYVDLRFAPREHEMRMSCTVTSQGLVVALHATDATATAHVDVSTPTVRQTGPHRTAHNTIRRRRSNAETELIGRDRKRLIVHPDRNCDTCSEHACARYRGS